jgi:sensor c-di-GMP phosphodiesterase-like protein
MNHAIASSLWARSACSATEPYKDMHTRAVARLQLEMDLRRAIERQEFRLYYQPIIFLENGKIHGIDAPALMPTTTAIKIPPEYEGKHR